MHPSRRWTTAWMQEVGRRRRPKPRTSRSRARSSRMHHASYPVFVHRPAVLDWASFRPRLTTTPLPFSLPSALRKPGHRTCTYEVTCHARHTRPNQRRGFSRVRLHLLVMCAEFHFLTASLECVLHIFLRYS